MIEVLQLSTESCLAVRLSSKVTSQEYQQFLDALEERLKTGGRVSLVIEFANFEFYSDFAAARKDLKFGFGDYKRIHRAAFVGDQKWIEWFTRLVGPFTRAEEKQFPEGELQTAWDWACE
jgi:hypothetical protein